jgi:ElaB/YqjD/DUF883 family membrane-anchored ribosome-binding protein
MNYKLQSEDEQTFTVQGADGECFRIAKSAVPEHLHKKVRGLPPLKMAEGGIVPDLYTLDPTEAAFTYQQQQDDLKMQDYTRALDAAELNNEIAFNPINPSATPFLTSQQAEDKALADLELQKSVDEARKLREAQALEQAAARQAAVNARREALGLPAVDAGVPAPIAEVPVAEVPAEVSAVPAQPQAPSMGSGMGTIQDIMNTQKSAVSDMQRVLQESAKKQEEIYAQQEKMQADYQARLKTNFETFQAEQDKLMNDYHTAKIDPNRAWSNAGVGGKIGAVVGMLLSGVGSAMAGQQNLAMKVIDDTIARDIEAQKSEIGKKHNLLSINLQKYRDMSTAEAATQAQQLAITQAKLQQVAANAAGGQAAANAKLATAEIQAKMLPLMQKVAAAQAFNQSPIAMKIQLLPEDVQKEAWKELGEYNSIQSNIAQVKKVLSEGAKLTSLSENLKSPLQTASMRDTLSAKLFPIVKAIVGERMTDSDAKTLITPYLPKMTDSNQTIERKTQALVQQLTSQSASRTPRLSGMGLLPDPNKIPFKPLKGN